MLSIIFYCVYIIVFVVFQWFNLQTGHYYYYIIIFNYYIINCSRLECVDGELHMHLYTYYHACYSINTLCAIALSYHIYCVHYVDVYY